MMMSILDSIVNKKTETKIVTVKISDGPTILQFVFQTILKQLTDMGFKETRARKALILNRLVNLWS